VRFLGSERGNAHDRWYRAIAPYYDQLYDRLRTAPADAFLRQLFSRYAPIREVLNVACGSFALDLPLVRRGYHVVGRDRSKAMLRVARGALKAVGRNADLGEADMRTLRLNREFDALLCLGTAFNYVTAPSDVRRSLASFRRHLRNGGLLVLDLTNFDAWIRHPQNARAEVDYRSPDGTRIAIFGFNEQERRKKIHRARFLTVVQRGNRIDVRFDETPLRIWEKPELDRALRTAGFRPVEWWGDLRLGAKYERVRSPPMVSVSVRT
jgi:SAM-dependent methyltransferase